MGVCALRKSSAGFLGLELSRVPEALDLAQPARQLVPTRENLARHIPTQVLNRLRPASLRSQY